MNASPAADVVVPLLALDAEVSLVDPDGARVLKLADLLLGPGQTARHIDEVIDGIAFARLPAAQRHRVPQGRPPQGHGDLRRLRGRPAHP